MAAEEKVKEIIVEQLGVEADQVKPEASFIDDLGADSLDTVELVMEFEDEFETSIPDDQAEKIQNIGQAIDFITRDLGMLPLHRGQVSVTYPGYPRPRWGEGEAAFRYRLNRGAAHVDGLKPSGPDRRRHVDEPHGWILGLPLTEAPPEAAPLILWEGSHRILGPALARAMEGHPPEDWHRVDVTEAYQAARREVFETCPRIALHARPGEAYLLHRHCLHGVAPWAEGAAAGPDGRMIAYFRPLMPGGVPTWIGAT